MPGIEARAPERTLTELRADDSFDLLQRGLDFGLDRRRHVAGLHELHAHRSRDGEARRHRDAEVRHLGEARAFAAEDVLRLGVALCLACPEEVDLLGHGGPTMGRAPRCGKPHTMKV